MMAGLMSIFGALCKAAPDEQNAGGPQGSSEKMPLVLNLKDASVNGVKLGGSPAAAKVFGAPSFKSDGVIGYEASGLSIEVEDDEICAMVIQIRATRGKTGRDSEMPKRAPADLTIVFPNGVFVKVTDTGMLERNAALAGIKKTVQEGGGSAYSAHYSFENIAMMLEISPDNQFIQIDW